jgi:hypothetical protein
MKFATVVNSETGSHLFDSAGLRVGGTPVSLQIAYRIALARWPEGAPDETRKSESDIGNYN